MTKTTFFALVGVLGLSTSCATILGTKQQTLNIYSNAQKAQLVVNDSLVDLPYAMKVTRSKKPLKISYLLNNQPHDTLFKAKPNVLFLLGNIPSIPFFAVGYGVDFTNPKRFRYPKNIFLNDDASKSKDVIEAEEYIHRKKITDSERKTQVYLEKKNVFEKEKEKNQKYQEWVHKRFHPQKGTTYFNLITPSLYSLGFSNQNPETDYFTSEIGGISFGVALDHFYKDHKFLTLEISHKSNLFDPIFWYQTDVKDKLSIALMDGYKWDRWYFSYGLAFTATRYDYYAPIKQHEGMPQPGWSDDEGYRRTFSTAYQNIGLSSVINYQFAPRLFVGISYKPSFYSIRFHKNGFDYEHSLGLDFRIKF